MDIRCPFLLINLEAKKLGVSVSTVPLSVTNEVH